ncbi:hypothetical protein THRCLA_07303 [Thraustotheca clavata]|uniref:Ribosomal RNA large subunit methyltransferase K/L-like methyltransferase domain-containing protein n=1 Tax=Thraustotheca clavata TaxID=74557 RepID=A0A1V9ZEE7_9STRA|nr:hypothetical protein THRCLA_07303 [Thraustotheca clavata]
MRSKVVLLQGDSMGKHVNQINTSMDLCVLVSFCTLLVRNSNLDGVDLEIYKDKSLVQENDGIPVQVCFELIHFSVHVAPWEQFPATKRYIVHGDEIQAEVVEHVNKNGRKQLMVKRWKLVNRMQIGGNAADPSTLQKKMLEDRLAKASAILCNFVPLPARKHSMPLMSPWKKAALSSVALGVSCSVLSLQGRVSVSTAVSIAITSMSILATHASRTAKGSSHLPMLPEADFPIDYDVCRLFATVPAGFQDIAASELMEKVDAFDIELLNGKVVFSIPRARLSNLTQLRSIEKLYFLLLKASNLLSTSHVVGQLQYDVPAVLPAAYLQYALNTWQEFHGKRNPTTYRVTIRLGGVVPVAQAEAAQALAQGINDRFPLEPLLKDYDVELYGHLQYPPPYSSGSILFGLTLVGRTMAYAELGHNIGNGFSSTGRQLSTTTLRPTIAFSLLRLGQPQISTILLDPMCGCGTIPELAARHFEGKLFCLAGDYASAAIDRANYNAKLVAKSNPNMYMDVVQWDCQRLPIRRDMVDALVTDMPFGKRIGSHAKNNKTYPQILNEFCRVVKKGTGNAVLLTTERELTVKQIQRNKTWIVHRQSTVNVGGLDAKCFHLSYL